ncbi:MAG: serine hydrolase domain-containing protein [Cyanobacteria bacterium J06621_3]
MTVTLKTAPVIAAPFGANTINEIDTYLETTAQQEALSGNVIVSRGRGTAIIRSYGLANREHWVPNAANTRFRIGSVTKQFTAAAILQLQQQNLLNIHAPITSYLPDYPHHKSKRNCITIHHLLTHSSGIPEYLNPDIFSDISEWMKLPTTLEQIIDRFKYLPLVFEPGKAFMYSNSGYVLLTQIIESISGQSYADYMQANIFAPLGMNNTGYEVPKAVIPNLAQGYLSLGGQSYLQAEPIDMSLPQGAGGLYSTVEDLATWHQWLSVSSAGQPTLMQPPLSKASVTLLLKPVIAMGLDRPGPDAFYGYGFVHDTYVGHQLLHHNGSINGFASSLSYYPEEKLTVGILANCENTLAETISKNLAAIVFNHSYLNNCS